MPRRRTRSQSPALSTARRQLERWRSRRDRGVRIPEELWQAAVEAAREDGLSRTATELRLDYYGLKERLASSVSEEESGFQEVSLPGLSMAADCTIEITDGPGTRLRVELRGSAAAQLASLVEKLWRATR